MNFNYQQKIENLKSSAITALEECYFEKYKDELDNKVFFPHYPDSEAGKFTVSEILDVCIRDWVGQSEVVIKEFTGNIDADWDNEWTLSRYIELVLSRTEDEDD